MTLPSILLSKDDPVSGRTNARLVPFFIVATVNYSLSLSKLFFIFVHFGKNQIFTFTVCLISLLLVATLNIKLKISLSVSQMFNWSPFCCKLLYYSILWLGQLCFLLTLLTRPFLHQAKMDVTFSFFICQCLHFVISQPSWSAKRQVGKREMFEITIKWWITLTGWFSALLSTNLPWNRTKCCEIINHWDLNYNSQVRRNQM